MEENTEITFTDIAETIAITSRAVWKQRKPISAWIGLAALVGSLIAFGTQPEYAARMRLLPFRGEASAGTGLSGIAGIAGIRLPTNSTDRTITSDIYPEVAKSIDFRISVAETPLYFSSLNTNLTASDYFRKKQKKSANKSQNISQDNSNLKEYANTTDNAGRSKTNLSEPVDETEPRRYEQKYIDLVESIGERISITVNKKTAIIEVSATMPDPYAAANLVQVASQRLLERISAYESQKAEENFRFISKRYEEVKNRYESAARELASHIDRNRMLIGATAKLETNRLQRENDISYEVFQQLSRDLEQGRLKLNQATPVFTVLDAVQVPNQRISPRRTRIILLSAFFGALIGVAHLSIKSILSEVETKR